MTSTSQRRTWPLLMSLSLVGCGAQVVMEEGAGGGAGAAGDGCADAPLPGFVCPGVDWSRFSWPPEAP